MKLKFGHNNIELNNNNNIQTNVQLVFSFDDKLLTNAKKHTNNANPNKLDDLQLPGAVGKLNDERTIVISLGNKNSFTWLNYLKAIESSANVIKQNKKITSLSIIIEESLSKVLGQTTATFVENHIFHLFNYLYSFDELKSERKKLSMKLVNFITTTNQKTALENAIHLINGVFLVKDLANAPANIATPTMLANTSKNFENISKKVKVEILEEKDVKKFKMKAFLAVAQGADSALKFIQMEYSGAAKSKKPIVLIGKGITFDSGGISIKPSPNMDAMKYDMCGAATVIGLFKTVVNLALPINLVCLVPSCENMPSGKAVKPGDVVKTMSGKTVEILNTDAEGRLILCDALTYAARYEPELVIDMATLTGACIVALGKAASGLYSNDDTLAKNLTKSGEVTNDKVWRMPLFAEYNEMLIGTVADLSNIGGWKGEAGSVTAACFLEQFTSYKWAHLDIAGPAMGGSGRPFYMMMDFLRNIKE